MAKCRKLKKKWCVVRWNREELERKVSRGFGPVGITADGPNTAEMALPTEGCKPR